jgi:hypothetical protein
MSLSDVYRDRYYSPGYVYILGSKSARVLKIGTTVNLRQQVNRNRSQSYGGIGDWVLLYRVWVEEGGKTEHDARRQLKRYRDLRMYWKDGRSQKGRELVNCGFTTALQALVPFLSENEFKKAWQSGRCDEFEFDRPPPVIEPVVYPLPDGWKPPAFLFFMKVEQLELSIRSSNCLRNDDIVYLGELVTKTEEELLSAPNFGRKSLNEIREVLIRMNLQFGMKIPGWPLTDRNDISSMFPDVIFMRVEELEVSVRSFNCLRNDEIVYVGELVQKSEAEMLRVPNYGRKSLNEIKEVLAQMGLHLDMIIPCWPPSDQPTPGAAV